MTILEFADEIVFLICRKEGNEIELDIRHDEYFQGTVSIFFFHMVSLSRSFWWGNGNLDR